MNNGLVFYFHNNQLLKKLSRTEDADFKLSDTQIDNILQKITWHLPFYLQAIVQSLFDRYEEKDNGNAIHDKDIEAIFLAMTQAKSPYSSYFENWQQRLKKAFTLEEFALAKALLSHSAMHNGLEKNNLDTLKKQYTSADYRYVMQTLEYDGYLNERYRFNSYLLQQWWLKNVID